MPAPEGAPAAVYDLMLKCWEQEPKNRPRFEEVYNELQSITSIGVR